MTQVSSTEQWECWGHSPGWSYTWSLVTELAVQRYTHPLSTDPFYSLRSPPALRALDFSYMDIFPFSASKWSEHMLCPPVLSEPTEKEHWKWLLKCFPSHLEHRLWGKPPNTGPALTPGSHPYLLSLRNESWAASLYYEIKIVPEDLKGRK